MVDFFLIALSSNIPHFKELLISCSGVDLLNLTKKVNNKNEAICRVIGLIVDKFV